MKDVNSVEKRNNKIIKTIKFIFISSFLFLLSCGIKTENDIYIEYPINTKLNINILKKSEQIVPYNNDFILLLNISTNEEYKPHLIFFNHDLKLYGATYFSSEKIEKIDNYIISAYLNENRINRAKRFINDLPKLYNINLIPDKNKGSGRIENKIIEDIKIINEKYDIKICIRKSENKYTFPSDPKANNLDLISDFPIKDTLIFQLNELNVNYYNNTVSSRIIKKNKEKIWDNMVVLDNKILDAFYSELMKMIKKNIEKERFKEVNINKK